MGQKTISGQNFDALRGKRDSKTALLILEDGTVFTGFGFGAGAIKDSFSLRHTAVTNRIPYYTTVAGSRAAAEAICALRAGQLGVRPLQDYLADIS